LAKLLLEEPGSAAMRLAVDQSDLVASAAIAYAELRALLARAARDGRIGQADRPRGRVLVDRIWDGIAEVPVDGSLIRQAGDLADRHGLRGYDAVHLAALLALGGADDVRLACWDDDLAAAARGLGYTVVGAVTQS
jgi:predicted nucleic acid-binding protein